MRGLEKFKTPSVGGRRKFQVGKVHHVLVAVETRYHQRCPVVEVFGTHLRLGIDEALVLVVLRSTGNTSVTVIASGASSTSSTGSISSTGSTY